MLLILSVAIWYIPGLWSGEVSQEDAECLKRTFAAEEVVCKSWCSPGTAWPEAVAGADAFADKIFDELRQMDAVRRSGIVLVGHSLGARVVSKAVARLAGDGLTVSNSVLLGSAMSSDVGLLKQMLPGCSDRPIVVSCDDDVVLKYIYPLAVGDCVPPMGRCTGAGIGAGVIEYVMPEDFAWQYNLLFPSHNSSAYIRYLEKSVHGDNACNQRRTCRFGFEFKKLFDACADGAVNAASAVTNIFCNSVWR